MSGKERRMQRIFIGPQRRCLMTPLDHAPWLGPLQGIHQPKEIVQKVLAGGTNALLVTPGFLKQVASLVSPEIGTVLRVSIVAGPSAEAIQETPAATLETALRMDVDAVAVSIFFGRGGESGIMRWMSELIESAYKYDMPVLAEMMPAADKFYQADAIAHVARLGMELGADIIKTNYCGDPVAFRQVVDAVRLPIIIAGGENKKGEDKVEGTINLIKEIVAGGASGVAIGRKVWQDDDPEALVRKMKEALFLE
ncbi:class I fructose-bisphosphate aldolase [Candidatus Formimonas warabiya]|uniref:Fructose-bisphosphate aldolase n=1 Tax=Formimonas warabiya TaxID=1761012 RepID=A0A3G1KTW0_FORW1|nr:hypothetical protein [Candidatus Formimonas warabiya]ATW25886.1 hypothetical protein DCMF_14890 [Candidatus Formimonas warabiya]